MLCRERSSAHSQFPARKVQESEQETQLTKAFAIKRGEVYRSYTGMSLVTEILIRTPTHKYFNCKPKLPWHCSAACTHGAQRISQTTKRTVL